MVIVPEVVRNKAAMLGADAWVRDLPALLASVASDWGLTIGSTFTDGTEALVVAVERADGTPAVLKLMIPRASDDAV